MSTTEICPSKKYNVNDFKYEKHCADEEKNNMRLALHPDKNRDCVHDATFKYQEWNTVCETGSAASEPLARAATATAANPYTRYAQPQDNYAPPRNLAEERRQRAQQQYEEEKAAFQRIWKERAERRRNSTPTCVGVDCVISGGRKRKRSRKRKLSTKRPRRRNTRRCL